MMTMTPATPGRDDTTEAGDEVVALNPFLPDASARKTFTDEGVCELLDRWAADEREREAWGDRDASTYRYRADLLEAAALRLRAATASLDALTDLAQR